MEALETARLSDAVQARQAMSRPAVRASCLRKARWARPFPFAKRMDSVDLAEIEGDALHELCACNSSQPVLAEELAKDSGSVRLNVLGKCKKLAFGDRDGANSARPWVDIPEDS
jgi:hypothetical protein